MGVPNVATALHNTGVTRCHRRCISRAERHRATCCRRSYHGLGCHRRLRSGRAERRAVRRRATTTVGAAIVATVGTAAMVANPTAEMGTIVLHAAAGVKASRPLIRVLVINDNGLWINDFI